MSVNLYMFLGVSSFGFIGGALTDPSYKALIPSYYYDAPLSEAGEYTPKYHLLRDLLHHFNRGESFPDLPDLHYRECYEPAIMYQHRSLGCSELHWGSMFYPFVSQASRTGRVFPWTTGMASRLGTRCMRPPSPAEDSLGLGTTSETALVFVDINYIGIFKRQSMELVVPAGKEQLTLSLLVENCGSSPAFKWNRSSRPLL